MSYERYYEEYRNEVNECVGTYLAWKQLTSAPAKDEELLSALNDTPTSWILIRHSLQVTTFISLARIFDVRSDSFSIDDLLKCCLRDIHLFSKNQLRARKIAGYNGVEPDWLNSYIDNAYEPSPNDFRKLKTEVAKYRNIFESNYRDIRHKIFAHRKMETLDSKDQLWAKTNISEIESIIWFLNDLSVTLWEAFHNGCQPILQGRSPDIEHYTDDFNLLLSKIKMT